MVYITKWDEFCVRALALYNENPTRTRYCIRYRHTRSLLVLKVTDDTTCLKFKTYSAIFLNRFDTLTKRFTAAMQNREVDDPLPTTLPSGSTSATP
ncbi:signal recognition particle, SRP9/SRP14 subunit, partial [Atractiella rhizophila]